MRASRGAIRLGLGLLAAVCFGAVACARVQERPAAASPPPVAGAAAGKIDPASGPAKPASTDAADLNRKIFTRITPPAAEADLPLGSGDLIEVSVFDVPEFSNLRVRIPVGGTVTLPLIGAIAAAGLTPVELEKEIRTRLQQEYMNNPQVSVFVTEQKSQRVSVIGAVRSGGVYLLTGRVRLVDALAMAGGLADDAGQTLYLIRRGLAEPSAAGAASPEPAPAAGAGDGATSRPAPSPVQEAITAIDLQALADGREEFNLPIQSGDVINVPRAGSYYVGGEVMRPGSFVLKTRLTVEEAIVSAGGVKDVADWGDIRVYRPGLGGQREVLTYSLDEFQKGDVAPGVSPDDVIIVGKSKLKVFLYTLKDFLRPAVGASAIVPIP
jgi:polysaccharide biosynthesis/export protein